MLVLLGFAGSSSRAINLEPFGICLATTVPTGPAQCPGALGSGAIPQSALLLRRQPMDSGHRAT